MVQDTKAFGRELRALRESRGLTLRDVFVAGDGELTWQAISHIERGDRQPGSRALTILARALGVEFRVDKNGIQIED